MRTFMLIIFMLIINLFAQTDYERFDIRIGIGSSLLGTGDVPTVVLENELNYRMNDFFSASASLSLARGDRENAQFASYEQSNLNIFISPFRNNRQHDFRIGTGLTVYKVSDNFLIREDFTQGPEVVRTYEPDQRTSSGFNMIIEHGYHFNQHYLLGTKLFFQRYQNRDTNFGLIFKFGFSLH